MEDIMKLAKQRADKFGVRNVVVSTNTGASANHVRDVFGADCLIIAVGNPPEAHDKGLVRHSGVSLETRRRLEQRGIKVILQNQSLIQAIGIGGMPIKIDEKTFDIGGQAFRWASLQHVIEKSGPTGEFNAVAILYAMLRWLGDGVQVCLETTWMAADSGDLPLDQDCIAIARPSPASNCPHAAVIMRPTKLADIFNGSFRIKDIVLAAQSNDHWFDNRPLWQG